MTQENYKNRLIEIITRYLPDASIYLYGSRVRKNHREGADIALDNKEKISFTILSAIQEALEESTNPLFVGLVDIHSVFIGISRRN